MTVLASNHLSQLVSDSCWGKLVTAEVKTWVDLSKLDSARMVRVSNALKRGQITGLRRDNTNVAVFIMLCETFKIPFVLKGINEAEMPTRPEHAEDFAAEVNAMLALDKAATGSSRGTVNVYGQPSPTTNPNYAKWYEDSKRLQLGKYPVVHFTAPESGYTSIFNLYDKYRLPSNQPGINEAVRVLKAGSKFEIPMTFTTEYVQ
jgi:hypothetical protein